MKKKILIGIGLLVLALSLTLFLIGCTKSNTELDAFATCLTESGARMFGAYWCSHCNKQKEDFGSSWQYIDYVECSLPAAAGQTEICAKEEITGYPTWEFGDGKRLSGELSFETLALNSNCSLPK